MSKTYVFVRAVLGVVKNSGVTPVICTREFLPRRSGGASSSNLNLWNVDIKISSYLLNQSIYGTIHGITH